MSLTSRQHGRLTLMGFAWPSTLGLSTSNVPFQVPLLPSNTLLRRQLDFAMKSKWSSIASQWRLPFELTMVPYRHGTANHGRSKNVMITSILTLISLIKFQLTNLKEPLHLVLLDSNGYRSQVNTLMYLLYINNLIGFNSFGLLSPLTQESINVEQDQWPSFALGFSMMIEWDNGIIGENSAWFRTMTFGIKILCNYGMTKCKILQPSRFL